MIGPIQPRRHETTDQRMAERPGPHCSSAMVQLADNPRRRYPRSLSSASSS